jgi:hypothetical protein
MLAQSHSTTISTLNSLARRYVKSEADAARLADRALQMVSEDPSLLDDSDIDKALFRLVHRIARQDFEIPRASPLRS